MTNETIPELIKQLNDLQTIMTFLVERPEKYRKKGELNELFSQRKELIMKIDLMANGK